MKNGYTKVLAAVILSGGSACLHAADVRINGFASVVAGSTLNEAQLPDGSDTTFIADEPSGGEYKGEVSFRPDSIYGLQITADLGDKLTATGQITGAGGEDFDANVAWAYLTYSFNEHWKLTAGRQRSPTSLNADFLDVGYAYHWVRPPTEASIAIDNFEGVKFGYEAELGSWYNRISVYYGETRAVSPSSGSQVGSLDATTLSWETSNDWLMLRGFVTRADFFSEGLEQFGQGEDSPVEDIFFGLGGTLTLGDTFITAEVISYEFEESIVLLGWKEYTGGYLSIGRRIGDWTPHATFGFQEQKLEDAVGIGDGEESSESITVGLRWDFHPAAAFKFEYETRSDESGDNIKAVRGESFEVDVVTVGIDLLF